MQNKPLNTLCLVLCTYAAGHCLEVRAQASVSVTQRVVATERAFAKTMADRDQPQFSRLISAEAVFFSGATALRGKSKISDGWLKYFKTPQAPFSWEPSNEKARLAAGLDFWLGD